MRRYIGLVGMAAILCAAGCGREAAKAPAAPAATAPPSTAAQQDRTALQSQATAMFQVLPPEMDSETHPVTAARVALGRALYYETRLSKNQSISCNSCHDLAQYGVDGQPTSLGDTGERGGRNSPTTYNAALHIAQFWDGRAADVEAQAKGPVLNPVEMGMPDAGYVVRVLKSIPGYTDLFKAAFPEARDPVNYDNAAAAIGAFERRLVTPSPFDKFLAGDVAALSDVQLAGLNTFIASGCTACHSGVGIGGGMYQKIGLVKTFATTDTGREQVTKNPADRFFFKVPSLRNIEKTGPYFHDGQVVTLNDAVSLMAEHQLGRTLTDAQVSEIMAFLGSLTGPIPAEYIARPALPESGPDTPKPGPV